MIEVRDIQDFSDYLDTLLNQTECDDIEFKSAAGGFPDSFWDTYSAFANTDGGTMANSATSGTNKVATSDDNSATSENKVATSDGNSATSKNKVATSDDNSATSEVIKTKKRMKKEDLWLMMENVCEDWISIENIVAATGLSYSYLRNTVIPQMIKEKQLVMMYPGTPNHPKQQYKHKE